MSTTGAAHPRPHVPGERFHCRVAVEDICVSVEGSAASPTTALFWEEARVACKFNGTTQRTRWIALQPAMDEVRKELQAAAGDDGTPGAAVPQTGGLLALAYTPFNNMNYEVEFTAETPEDPAVTSVTTVKPKRIHLMEFVVEAQNMHRVYSATGGQMGDRAPTSGNMEVISASLNKKAAKVSAWTRSLFSKIGSSSADKKEEEAHNHHHQSSKERNEAAMASLADHNTSTAPSATNPTAAAAPGDLTVHEGIYETVAKHIDVSEAYNRPGGKQYYCLVVRPESRKLPGAGTGTPLTISFSVVAHYGDTESVPRSFHNFALVIDQFVLDYSEASRVLPPDPRDDSEQPRPIVGYAFGFTANTSANPNAMEAASKMVPVVTAAEGEGAIRVVDFDRLHREVDERKRTPDDYKALPTSCVVVSGSTGEKAANKPRLGNRVTCVSRFKTSPDGLCKPSFKCQFLVSLVRFYGDGSVSSGVRESAAPINLAALMNEEIVPQRIRAVKFELGEVMYMRLRRCCFADPALLRAPLLLPYDYDNANVQLPAPPQQQQQQGQQREAPAPSASAPTARSNESAAAAAAAAIPAVAAAPPSGVPDISFATSSSSSDDEVAEAPRQEQRSGSDSDASTPRVAVQRDPTAPLFTLEPQEDSPPLQFGSTDANARAPTAQATQSGARPAYDPFVAAATAWGGHTPAPEDAPAAPAFEVTPSASNPFFSSENNHDSQHHSRGGDAMPQPAGDSDYDFGSAAAQAKNTTAPAFELTPFE